MHTKTNKRSTFTPLTQKIKAPEHLSRLSDYDDKQSEVNGRFQLPSLQRRKSWKDTDSVTSWGRSSARTSASWSPEIEDVTARRVIQQWEAVERTLYDEQEQVSQAPVLEECIQWRTQIPHLRIVGKNPFLSVKDRIQDVDYSRFRSNSELQNVDAFSESNTLEREKSSSSRRRSSSFKTAENDILNILFEYVVSRLFSKKEDETNLSSGDLSNILRISPAPVYANKSSAKSTKSGRVNWTEEIVPIEDKLQNNKNRVTEDPLISIKNEIMGIHKQRTSENPLNSSKLRNSKGIRDGTPNIAGSALCRPQTSRNKLGAVFNEKIVVSPVPYVLSTKESFSTLRKTPIKFMGQSPGISTIQGSARNISSFGNYMRKSTPLGVSIGQSAWHAPVSPAVWPKNIKLAPIDTTRLPCRKNRSLAPSPALLQSHKKSLSPISRTTLPASAHSVRNESNEVLEIQGKHIIPGQSPRSRLLNSSWDFSPRVTRTKKKKGHTKEEK